VQAVRQLVTTFIHYIDYSKIKHISAYKCKMCVTVTAEWLNHSRLQKFYAPVLL
jgi:hypothetical protein